MIHELRFFDLSISDFNKRELAIFSKTTGEFSPLNSKSKILKSVKKKFKSNICDRESFCFSFMDDEQTTELINLLNGRK